MHGLRTHCRFITEIKKVVSLRKYCLVYLLTLCQQRHSIHGMTEEENVVRPHQEMAVLSLEEKKYLLGVERGDVAGTRRVLQRARDTGHINVDCVDPLGRSALLMAIDNENLEMVELLLEFGVETRDALLHAISEEFVEAVEALLDHEERTRKPGELHVSLRLGLL